MWGGSWGCAVGRRGGASRVGRDAALFFAIRKEGKVPGVRVAKRKKE